MKKVLKQSQLENMIAECVRQTLTEKRKSLNESYMNRLIENAVRDVLNEENVDEANWKGALAGLAMGASTMFGGGNPAQAQTTDTLPQQAQSTFQVNYQNAQFSQGDFGEWLNRTVKYPQSCYNEHIQGRVYVRFTVDTYGHVTNINVVRSPNEDLSKAAVDAIRRSPSWKPAVNKGQRVNQDFMVPVVFRIK